MRKFLSIDKLLNLKAWQIEFNYLFSKLIQLYKLIFHFMVLFELLIFDGL